MVSRGAQKAFPEGEDKKKLNKPQAGFCGLLCSIPIVELLDVIDKGVIVEELVILAKVEFDGIEKVEGVIE